MRASLEVRWLVGRLHVATSFADVAADIAARAEAGGMAPRARARAITQACIAHRANRADYARVMA